MSTAGVTFPEGMKSPPPLHTFNFSLRDFPDRLSPMVVKELRQGLRSPIFVWAFLVMHLVLGFTVLASLGSENKADTTVFFWWTVVIPLSLVLPLRGFNALNEERRLNTYDTLVLTRLSALRISFGKWAAISAQCLLLAVTVLPYLVMRYFAGGVNVTMELRWLVHFTALGMLFAAGMVGFSWVKYFFLRGLMTLGMGALMTMACGVGIFGFLMREDLYSYSGIKELELPFTIGSYLLAAFTGYYLLDYAAAQISPQSENRSTPRRLASLGMVILCFAAGLIFNDDDIRQLSLLVCAVITAIAGVDAATEQTRHFSVICHPFVKKGILGKLAGRFLYPGWHSGILFLLLLTTISLTSAAIYFFYYKAVPTSPRGPWSGIIKLCMELSTMLGQVFFVLLLMRLFFKKSKFPLVLFLLIQAALMLIQGLLSMFASSMRQPGINLLAFPSPISHAVYQDAVVSNIWRTAAYGSTSRSDVRLDLAKTWLPISGGLALAYLAILFVMAAREFRRTREMEREAAKDLESFAKTSS